MSTFGTDISIEDLIDTLSFFDNWEDRYRYIIELGKQITPQNDDFKLDERLIKGCQSQVWMDCQKDGDRLFFIVDSDAHIVKGLLGVVLIAYNGKTSAEVLDFDIEAYFSQLDLIKHLSPTRGNGLRSMVKRIQAFAAQ